MVVVILEKAEDAGIQQEVTTAITRTQPTQMKSVIHFLFMHEHSKVLLNDQLTYP